MFYNMICNSKKIHKYSIEIASLSTAAAGQGAAGAAAALRLDPAVAREGFVNVGGGHFGGLGVVTVVVGQLGGLGLVVVEEELESSRLCDTLAFFWLGFFKAAGSTRNRCVRVHGKDQEEASYGIVEGTEEGEQLQRCP